MIEDKKIGLKVATKEEALWIDVAESTEKRILNSKVQIQIDENLLKLAKEKINAS